MKFQNARTLIFQLPNQGIESFVFVRGSQQLDYHSQSGSDFRTSTVRLLANIKSNRRRVIDRVCIIFTVRYVVQPWGLGRKLGRSRMYDSNSTNNYFSLYIGAETKRQFLGSLLSNKWMVDVIYINCSKINK